MTWSGSASIVGDTVDRATEILRPILTRVPAPARAGDGDSRSVSCDPFGRARCGGSRRTDNDTRKRPGSWVPAALAQSDAPHAWLGTVCLMVAGVGPKYKRSVPFAKAARAVVMQCADGNRKFTGGRS